MSDLIREVDFSDPELLKEEKFSDQELDDAGRDDFLTEVEKDEEEIPMNQLSSETDELAGNTPVTTAPAASPEIEDVLPSGAKATEGKAAVKKFTWDDDSLVLDGDGLERIRPEKGSDRVVRFAILDGPILAARNHFVQTVNGKSCRLCLSENGTPAWCCNKLGEDGRLRIISLALLYENADKRGGYPKNIPIEWRVGFVELSSSHFKAIRGLVPEGAEGVAPGRVTDIDCGMVLDKNRYAFKLISLKARWKQIPELAKEVKAAVAKALSDGGRRLEKRLGRKTSPIEWKQLLAERTAEPATVDNLEDNPF